MSSDWAQSPVECIDIAARTYFILASGWIWTDWDHDLALYFSLLSSPTSEQQWPREKLESELKFHLQLWQVTWCSNVKELLWKAVIWVCFYFSGF